MRSSNSMVILSENDCERNESQTQTLKTISFLLFKRATSAVGIAKNRMHPDFPVTDFRDFAISDRSTLQQRCFKFLTMTGAYSPAVLFI